MAARIPLSTYRLQFNQEFTFKDALALVPYFHALGISDLYASPILKSVPGSKHGYDGVDYTQLNPEIGSEEDFEKLSMALQECKMGFLLDIVPNHMSISEDNKWWQDVLENGPSSLFAHYFNITWNPPKAELKNKILLPVLDEQFGKVIENQELSLIYDKGAFFIQYKSRRFPVNLRTWPTILNPVIINLTAQLGESNPDLLELQSVITALSHLPGADDTSLEERKELNREKEIIKKRLATLIESQESISQEIQKSLAILNGQKGEPHSFDQLENLLNEQSYRLSFWGVTNDEINYHRFFDVNDLISLQIEYEDVFEQVHELILKYIQKGWITGLRIDHVDGLYDPQYYLMRLQQACAEVLEEKVTSSGLNFYIVVEKILGRNERLRDQWPVFGTTGYDFLNHLNSLFVVRENRTKFRNLYEYFIEKHSNFIEESYQSKKFILTFSMSSELHMLARHLEEVSEQHRWSRDHTFEACRSALRDVIACFPVYRSYIRLEDTTVQAEDRGYILSAIQHAKRVNLARSPAIFDFIQSVLLLEDPPGLTEDQILSRRKFVMRFQQLTGPVAAKGIEDTTLYRYYPLLSLNEVGMDPTLFGMDSGLYHELNLERVGRWPHAMLATSTHDSKRSEDARTRIDLLSEIPEEWKGALERWSSLNQKYKVVVDSSEAPDHNEEYLLYQTLVGTWPFDHLEEGTQQAYVDRIEQYFLKAIKEAKIHTSWVNSIEPYEKGCMQFIRGVLNVAENASFIKDFEEFSKPILKAGLFSSLVQTLFKITSPGVPDFYQGCELWNFSLVDPDNRGCVDYSQRAVFLAEVQKKTRDNCEGLVNELRQNLEDGRIKLYLISQGLKYRSEHASLFQEGEYIPLEVGGERNQHVTAFARLKGEEKMIVAGGRFFVKLLNDTLQLSEKCWEDTTILLTDKWKGSYRDVFTGTTFTLSDDRRLPVDKLFHSFPFVLLHKIA